MPWWAGKSVVKDYLTQINSHVPVSRQLQLPSYHIGANTAAQSIEYTLFQPGLFLDYLAFPHQTARYLTPLNTMIDFANRRAIVVEGYDPVMTFTTVQDLAAIVTRAVEYDGEWPENGGISGNRLPVSQIIKIGEKVRGSRSPIHAKQVLELFS
jgi:hypothetical protein